MKAITKCHCLFVFNRVGEGERERSNFGYLTVEMMQVWDLRVQSRLNLGESKT